VRIKILFTKIRIENLLMEREIFVLKKKKRFKKWNSIPNDIGIISVLSKLIPMSSIK